MFVSGYVYRLLRYEARQKKIPWAALMVLRDLELLGPTDQRTLAAIEQVRAPTMTVLIRQMEGRGWIRRKQDEDDGRFNQVSITPPGRKALREAGRILRQRLDEELTEVPAMTLRDLEEDLGEIATVFMKTTQKSVPPRSRGKAPLPIRQGNVRASRKL
jgi:DNA-binding MarR family transcriptional regulator